VIWLNPWAWLGLGGVVLPVLIHLLGRGHARVHRFPTLRFLTASRLLPTRRTRVHDFPLLAVRAGALALAAAALARPLVLTAKRARALDRGLARAIVVDTSESMRRAMPSGTNALDSARREARTLAANARTSVIVETSHPSRALAPASAWLVHQGRRGELVVVSDFQRGEIEAGDFAVVPKSMGVSLHRIPTVAGDIGMTASRAGSRIVIRTTRAGDRTGVEWADTPAASFEDRVLLLGGDADRAALEATRSAASTVAVPLPVDTARAIAIVFAGYHDAARLEAEARSRYRPWMVALLSRLRADPLSVSGSGVAAVAGRSRLVLFTSAEPGSLASARLTAEANRATSIAPEAREREPESLSDATLASLQRPPADDVPSQMHPIGDSGPSDGRWLWLGVLALLALEIPLRRLPRTRSVTAREELARAS
jgi:hypothetical protein